MTRMGFIKGALTAFAAACVGERAEAKGSYPTVKDLENGLGAIPGKQIPKQIVTDGRVWNAYYVGAHSLGNGEYIVRIKLS